jgi:RimJ/RimL family protein N-acetyltransferase
MVRDVISYRVAEMTDAQFLFDLKNDPGVRESSILSRNGVQWSDHCDWLFSTLGNTEVALWIVLVDGVPAGTFRIDRVSESRAEAAIHLAAAFRRNGLGARILRDWCKDIGVKWVAKIVDTNAASIRLFTNAGFVAVDSQEVNGIPYHNYELYQCAS